MTTGSSSRIFRCSFFNSSRIRLAGLRLGHRSLVLAQLSLLAVCYSTWAASDPTAVIESLTGSGRGGEVIERGKDFAIVRTIGTTTNLGGSLLSVTNHVTLLENGLHYFADGEWRISRDVIEPFPGGAIARYGPNKTIFSSELLDEAVFDIETAEGHRIRGGVRAIQLTDIKTGRIAVLGTVRNGVRGEIIPPNQVVYRSGFDGIKADVLLV